MELNHILARVDVERLYRHVLNLEGERHPLNSPDRLNAAADYIQSELARCGVAHRRQTFRVDGFDGEFFNVEGRLGADDEPAAALLSHYDTYANTTGANDNAAAVAVMLEAARVLATEKDPPAIRFLSFSLEEGNPAFQSRLWQSARERGLMDERGRCTSYRASQWLQEHDRLSRARWKIGQSLGGVMAEVNEQMKDRLPDAVRRHLEAQAQVYAGVTFLPGVFGHIGAWKWMDEAIALKKRLAFGVCLDEIGRVNRQPGSQQMLPNMTWEMFRTYKVDQAQMIGDWVMLLTNGPAAEVGRVFCAHCEREGIDLPYSYLHTPLDYKGIVAQFPQALGSDYSAFWREDIPALFAFDTAGWRAPNYGHTMADTIEKLDFDQIARVCKATIATLIDPAARERPE
jgi:hypothetical protein